MQKLFIRLLAVSMVTHSAIRTHGQEDLGLIEIPLELEVNGNSKGEILAKAPPTLDTVHIQGLNLKEVLLPLAAEDQKSLIAALPDGFTHIDSIVALGVDAFLNLERLVIEVSIQEKEMLTARGSGRFSLQRQAELHRDQHIPVAKFSGYTNFKFRSVHHSNRNGQDQTLNMDHVFSHRGWSYEAESVYQSRSSQPSKWRIQRAYATKDLPKLLSRLRVGDISTPVSHHQRGFSVWGLSLASDFDLDPYGIFTPTGNAAFELEEASTVEVLLNGSKSKVLKLEPGSYNLDDFKLGSGQNTLDLNILGESGAIENLRVSEFGAPELLKQGLTKYAATLGFQYGSENLEGAYELFGAGVYERYLQPEPLMSGFLKKGLSKTATAEIGFQAKSNWQRVTAAMTHVDATGTYFASTGLNKSPTGKVAPSVRLSWRGQTMGNSLSFETNYTASRFNEIDESPFRSDKEVKLRHSAGLSRTFFDTLSASLDGYYETKHSGAKSWSIASRLGKRFGSVYASLSVRAKRNAGQSEYTGNLNLTWSPTNKLRTRSSFGFGSSGSKPTRSVNLNYSKRKPHKVYSSSVNLIETPDRQSLSGYFSQQSKNANASISHSFVYGNIDETSSTETQTKLEASTALAFADGSWGIANKIRDSFVIIDKHKLWKDVSIGVNPSYGGYEHEVKKSPFKPVIPDLRAYREEHAIIQSLQDDRMLETNDFYFMSGHRQGTKLVVGNEAIYLVRGTLMDTLQIPVSYKGIRLEQEGHEPISTFTNRAGRFVATGLSPGDWTLKASGYSETVKIRVEGDDSMILLGKVFLE